MSIKSTLVCDGCGAEIPGEPGGIPERHGLMDKAQKLGWEWLGQLFSDACRCPECVKNPQGSAAEPEPAPANPEAVHEATTFTFDFAIGQDVVIKELSVRGRVDGISVDSASVRYAVVYWLNGKREREHLHADEIEAGTRKAVAK